MFGTNARPIRIWMNPISVILSLLKPAARKVSGDVDELRAAFSNLLDNAVKYSDDEVSVSVSSIGDGRETNCCASG